MNVSSIPASAAPTPVSSAGTRAPQAPDATADDANDAGAAQPAVQAPLPPGQGTRVDQIV